MKKNLVQKYFFCQSSWNNSQKTFHSYIKFSCKKRFNLHALWLKLHNCSYPFCWQPIGGVISLLLFWLLELLLLFCCWQDTEFSDAGGGWFKFGATGSGEAGELPVEPAPEPDITDDQWLLFNNWLIISVLFRFESESFSFSSSEAATEAACWNKLRLLVEHATTAASAAEASISASKALILY